MIIQRYWQRPGTEKSRNRYRGLNSRETDKGAGGGREVARGYRFPGAPEHTSTKSETRKTNEKSFERERNSNVTSRIFINLRITIMDILVHWTRATKLGNNRHDMPNNLVLCGEKRNE